MCYVSCFEGRRWPQSLLLCVQQQGFPNKAIWVRRYPDVRWPQAAWRDWGIALNTWNKRTKAASRNSLAQVQTVIFIWRSAAFLGYPYWNRLYHLLGTSSARTLDVLDVGG